MKLTKYQTSKTAMSA